jgi:PilZ domain
MGTIGKRSESRLRVRLPARLAALDFSLPVTLCDLSKSGARIESAGLPLKCCDVVLTWREFEAFGRIMWSHSGETGIGFYDPIPPEWLIATRDLGEVDHRKDYRESNRRHAQEWVRGQTRI